MIGARFKPYPDTKDSGIEWLGQIPAHWEVRKLKHSGRFVGGGTPSKAEHSYWNGEIPWVSPKDMHTWEIFDTEDHITEQAVRESATEIVPGGSLLIVVRSGILRHTIPVAIACCNVALNQDMKALVADELGLVRYLMYVVTGKQQELLVEWRNEGATVESLEFERLAGTSFPYPNPDEQTAISDFLDRETAKIDALVGKKQRLSELLQEKRTALITHAVTKGLPAAAAAQAGLDPNVPVKDSGVEWLGEIPAHWETTSVRYQFTNLDHKRIPIANEDRALLEKIYPYYGASGIIDRVDSYLFDGPLVLVAEDGANLLSRSTPLAFLATGKYWVNNHAHILDPLTGDICYWVGVLQAYDYTPLISGAAQPKLTGDRLGSIRIPLPPDSEQREIAGLVDRETAKIDALIAKVREAIERLKEYRTALISAAVTGKIDVRDEAISVAVQDT